MVALPTQDYAALSDDVYKDRAVGRRAPGAEELVTLNGHRYKVLEHVDNRRNGYQGTVYQQVDTREIVVAHRGTEQTVRDGVITDGGMVLARTNLQATDALALTERAMVLAERLAVTHGKTPEVTVTGHSLGGTLAQITAHHYGLKGETFNAYGAASLGYRIPEGGNSMVNHVMAADPVSAASPHFGKVRIYATQKEIDTLANSGFSNSRFNALIPDSVLVAAGRSLDSHKLGNFLGEGSVLDNPQTRTLANGNQRMIEEYRDKLEALRSNVTILSRGIPGGAVDALDKLRGPLEPGEPARREAEKQRQDRASLRLDEPGHAAHPMFVEAQRGVRAQDARVGRTSDQFSDQLAGTLVAEMHVVGGKRIDTVLMSKDATHTFAVQGDAADPAHLRVSVDTMVAMNTPLERSSQRVEEQANSQLRNQDTLRLQEQEQAHVASRTMHA
ncbi:MAG: XVIPCD domain-containing protein [Stenotrophomonas sp.]